MKSYRKLAFTYFLADKKRTAVTIMGIMLVLMLIISVNTFFVTMKQYNIKSIEKNQGAYHVKLINSDFRQYNLTKKLNTIESSGYKNSAGAIHVEDAAMLDVSNYSKDALSMLNISLLHGRFPREQDEIAIEQWIGDTIKANLKVGDIIKVNIQNVNTGYFFEEAPNNFCASKNIINQFKICGIIKNKIYTQRSASGIGMITASATKNILKSFKTGSPDFQIYVRFKNKTWIQQNIIALEQKINANRNNEVENYDLLKAMGQSNDKFANIMYYLIVIILMAAVLAAGISVVYNDFDISVAKRLRHYGVISTIGGTPYQIIEIIIIEAALYVGVALVLAIPASFILVKLSLYTFGYLSGSTDIEMIISYPVVIVSIMVTVLTSLLTALIPGLKIAKLSPIESAKNAYTSYGEGKYKCGVNWLAKISNSIIKNMDVNELKLSLMNIKRNRKRAGNISTSVTIGVCMLIGFSAFIHYYGVLFVENPDGISNFSKDYLIQCSDDNPQSGMYTDKDLNVIKKIPGVAHVYSVLRNIGDLSNVDRRRIDNNFFEYELKQQNESPINKDTEHKGKYLLKNVSVYGYDNNLIQMCKENIIDGSTENFDKNINNGILVYEKDPNITKMWLSKYSDKTMQDIGINQFTHFKAGDEVWINQNSIYSKKPAIKKYRVIGIVNSIPIKNTIGSSITLVMNKSQYRELYSSKYSRIDVELKKNKLKAADIDLITNKLNAIATGVKSGKLINMTEENKLRQAKILKMQLILYAIVIVVAIMAFLNMVVTIRGGIYDRKAEIGMMRALGMTDVQVKKMLVIESLLYGLRGLVLGILSGLAISFCLYEILRKCSLQYEITYEFPKKSLITAIILVTIIGIIAGRKPIKQILSNESGDFIYRD